MIAKLTAIALLLLGSGIAWSKDDGIETALEMQTNCSEYQAAKVYGSDISVDVTTGSAICWGAFLALQEFSATTWGSKNVSILRNCVSPKASRGELIKVFLLYVDKHPQRGHEKFTDVVLSALWDAYPCPSGSGTPK